MARKKTEEERETARIIRGWKKILKSYRSVNLTREEKFQLDEAKFFFELAQRSKFNLGGPVY